MRTSPTRRSRAARAPGAILLALAATLATIPACSSDDPTAGPTGPDATAPTTTAPRAATLRVPTDHPTIQAAVDAARRGDLVLVAAGTYREAVTVTTPGITLRGTDRNAVDIDGESTRAVGVTVRADGVAVENLTVHHHTTAGVRIEGDGAAGRPLQGFQVRHVTAYDDGGDGIAAADATGGLIEDSLASGHPGAGIAIGPCLPCTTVVRNVVAERNAVGVRGTNAGGDLFVVSSTFRSNRVGIELLSSATVRSYPQRAAEVVANRVTDNDGEGAPRSVDPTDERSGWGIVVRGGRSDQVERNVVEGHVTAGIVVTADGAFLPEANRVERNELAGNGVDLAYVAEGGQQLSNCFGGNRFTTSDPPSIERALNCAPEATGGSATLRPTPAPPDVDWRTVPAPAPQPSLPDPTAAPRPVVAPEPPDLDTVTVRAP